MRAACIAGLAVAAVACGHAGGAPAEVASGPAAGPVTPTATVAAAIPAAVAPPGGVTTAGQTGLTLADARRAMVRLINRDRASMGLPPVELDEGPSQRAGQGHAEDMASKGYLGHWGSDGSVPEQRYSEAGGAGMVLENASCFTDEKARTLDPAARIDPRAIEQTEDMFFHETPPHDGHRKNILKPWHRRVGIGVAQPVATPTEIPVPCFAQEFVDDYGTYGAVPPKLRLGDRLHVEGAVNAPARFAGVGLGRIDAPAPIPVAELNRRRSYPVPTPYQMYWPPGFQTPIPVQVTANHFAVDLPVSDGGKPGLYEVSVWGNVPGTPELVMLSLRTMTVR